MAISSDAEFYVVVSKAVSKAIDEVIERIFAELQLAIERDIYNSYSPTSDYDRTGELLTAWKHETKGLFGNIEFQPEELISDPKGFHHNSPYGWDVRDQIFDILKHGYGAYNFREGKPIPSRPMWDEFIAKVDVKFDKWMRAALRRQGLVVI